MELAIMIEGQNGLNWERWKRLVITIDQLGFAGLFRSDHFTNANPPDLDSLELWVSLTWLAAHTNHLRFGPLVTPFSFRHPVFTVRMANAVDDLSSGRLVLGVGAGWQEREHNLFGLELLDVDQRMDRFEEGLEVITRLQSSSDPVNYWGKYYQLQEAVLLPKPDRVGGPPLLIGGNGRRRTLPLAAKYASEWNGVMVSSEEYQSLNKHLDNLLEEQGLKPSDVRRSIMLNLWMIGEFEAVERKASSVNRDLETLRQRGAIFGPPAAIVDQLGSFAEAGADMVMLQYLDLDNLNDLETLAVEVLPKL